MSSESGRNTQRGISEQALGQNSIRRSMLTSMLLVVGLFALAFIVTGILALRQVSNSLATNLIGHHIARGDDTISDFVADIEHNLRLLSDLAPSEPNALDDAQSHIARLLPLLHNDTALTSIIVVSPVDTTLIIARSPILHARIIVDDVETTLLLDGDSETAGLQAFPQFRLTDRPWFARAEAARADTTIWSEPYPFLTSNAPGITVTRRKETSAGRWLIGLDVELENLSDFTQSADVTGAGLMLITDESGRIVGLPRLPAFGTSELRAAAYLKRPDQLGLGLAASAQMAFQPDPDGSVDLNPVRFGHDGEKWWGQGKWIRLDEIREFWVGVIVPESALLAPFRRIVYLLIAVAVLISALALQRAASLSRRYSRPIGELARQSLRISEGSLDEPAQVHSSLRELRLLAEAHEKMRLGLIRLLQLKGDLEIARQIQQQTFPWRFPEIAGYDIAAGSIPADATGGDTFDVVGTRSESDGRCVLTDNGPQQVQFLLADATGHGVGPSLTATQVRAMFRMGARLAQPLVNQVVHINAQLQADTHGGRFVTAWFARLNTEDHRLAMFSAGQAPVYIFRAASGKCEEMPANSPPMGIVDIGSDSRGDEITLDLGDIVFVLSDGIYEARDSSGDTLGANRVCEWIINHKNRSANEMLMGIKSLVEKHLGGQPAADDQTGIILKRT